MIFYFKVYYDDNYSLLRYDFRPSGQWPYGNNDAAAEIHDFNTGTQTIKILFTHMYAFLQHLYLLISWFVCTLCYKKRPSLY